MSEAMEAAEVIHGPAVANLSAILAAFAKIIETRELEERASALEKAAR